MALTFGKVLAQVDVSAATSTDLYQAPSHFGAAVCVEICNRNASAIKFRISISVGGSALSNEDYVIYDASLPANATFEWGSFDSNLKTLGALDIVRCYSDTANVSFTVYGKENQ